MALHTTTENVAGLLPADYAPLVIEPMTAAALAFDPRVTTTFRTDSNTAHFPILKEDAAADWLTEGAEITPDDATFDEIVVTPGKVGGLSIVSRELATDSNPAAATIVGESLARDIARKIDAAFFGDLAAPAPKGLDALTTVPEIAYGTIANLDAFAEAISKLEEAGATATAFVTTPALALTLAQLKAGEASNEPLLGVDATNGTARQVLGVPVLVSSAIADGTIYAIDGRKTHIVLRNNVEVQVSHEAYFSSDRVGIKATARVGFAFPSPTSIVRMVETITP